MICYNVTTKAASVVAKTPGATIMKVTNTSSLNKYIRAKLKEANVNSHNSSWSDKLKNHQRISMWVSQNITPKDEKSLIKKVTKKLQKLGVSDANVYFTESPWSGKKVNVKITRTDFERISPRSEKTINT